MEIDPRLDAQIRRAAHNVCRTCPQMAEDASQESWFAILTRAEREPEFMAQAPAYIVTYGMWAARDWLRRMGYLRMGDASLDEDGAVTLADCLPSQQVPVERWVVSKITLERALAQMDETARTLAAALLMGYRKGEAAQAMGLTRPAMTYAGRRIAEALRT